MKKVQLLALTAVALTMVGCKTTIDDRWRSDLGTTLEEAHFRPVYEVLKDKGIVSGQAAEEYSWWGLVGSSPEVYAKCEVYVDIGDYAKVYDQIWTQVLAD